ncbi:unannotated protein [freshwater metagenome]|uniref:Unannotated protein n=1 Tax=freshwater metagenome TaxID=449393 RepID=A0A6J7CXU9_9ZZZZ|nr:hypothetical protein [Actinomycetota bacterium]
MSQHSSLPDSPTALETLLLDLATQDATGSLTVTDLSNDMATMWLRDGRLYTISVPGRRALLGSRMVSSGVLTTQALGEALEVQRTELQGWRLGELLVHLGYVNHEVIDDFIGEQLHDMLDSVVDWSIATSEFRNGDRTRHDVQSQDLVQLLKRVRERRKRWTKALSYLGSEDVVARLVEEVADRAQTLTHQQWAILCKIDGHHTVVDLADECGFTTLEAAELLVSLIKENLATIISEDTIAGPAILAPPVIVLDQLPKPVELDQDIVADEPVVVVEPVVVEPAVTEPVVAEQIFTEVVIAEPVVAEPVVAEQIFTEVVIAEPEIVHTTVFKPVAAEPTHVFTDFADTELEPVVFIEPAQPTVVHVPVESAPTPEEIHESRFELTSLLTVLNREADSVADAPAIKAAELAPEPSVPASTPSTTPTEFFSRNIDSAALMRELSSLSRLQEEAPAKSESASSSAQSAPRTASPVDPKKKRGLFTR